MKKDTQKNILIVDDALIMRLMLREILEAGGYKIIGEASDEEEAIEQYKRLKPDLVTMDLTLLSGNGMDAIINIKKIDPDARIVVVSAIDQDKTYLRANELRVKGFLVKPFEEEAVLNVIKTALL